MRRTDCSRGRRGISLLWALIALIILSFVTTAVLGLLRVRRGWEDDQLRRIQAAWLAEGGAERAASRLSADPSYPGETWEIPAESLDGRRAAEVLIAVAPLPGDSGSRRITVTARYPKEGTIFAKHQQTWTIATRKKAGEDQ